ncbi:Cationic peroxidase 1 [Hibiscus syriacus]|uniref:peroxidase n=1 Tax=Hibiscus syriacus TaxID=106335 RepID=A0A6A3BSG0_HIBSY|nr:Cationic peroxidase 1 [Hibiscus syriacus]
MGGVGWLIFHSRVGASVVGGHGSKLSPNHYKSTCPKVLSIVGARVEAAVKQEPRMGASLLRLHFHDCFVNGCDGSILLDDNSTFTGEKTAAPNNNSARGFDVVDDIKAKLEKACPGVVSCSDILAIAARDSTVVLGGPSWKVKLGRRDSTTASKNAARKLIPAPNLNLSALIFSFRAQGLSLKDLVALSGKLELVKFDHFELWYSDSGAHTIGLARCTSFRARIYNDSNIDPLFAKSLQRRCLRTGKDNVHRSLDLQTPTSFDNYYFQNLLKNKGLLHSDQELVNDASTNSLVKNYAADSSSQRPTLPCYYSSTCPQAIIVEAEVAAAIKNETRVGASLLRLHFHDCFVNGCDGSVLLDDNSTFIGEKTAVPNNNSARGFNVIDKIKARLEKACPRVVSCADILAIAARDSVVQVNKLSSVDALVKSISHELGGPSWKVRLGRRDSTTASRSAANARIPQPTFNLSALFSSFSAKGSHTIGLARCTSFRSHIYNDSDIDPSFANSLRQICPRSGNDNVLAPLDRQTPTRFDSLYYGNLLDNKGLLHSDQELFNGNSSTGDLVKRYAANTKLFFKKLPSL